ncbi:DUF1800 domain-containing protein [Neogemmobacter tilapiae]|uniref:DUF1800 domain-containing protein n=1 Tax=Neogemmobacter tilapiae TaxID=875041 RepID=A0A918TWL2_9RHOB|nr:DUF1800 domain-containing protein [Gemmobacter tilapiae]GHC65003.1 hypothetical protein GCM10007315_31850 [Gemmobacter tilapiae]
MTDRQIIAATRFGYGLPLPAGAPVEAGAMLSLLAGPDTAAVQWPGVHLDEAILLFGASYEARLARRTDDAARIDFRRALEQVNRQAAAGQAAIFARALGAPDGFRERLVQFWADHFTTVPKLYDHKGVVLSLAEDAVRPHVAGRFAEMLKAATLHPAMLLFLDQQVSVGPNSRRAKDGKRGLNENLGRELLELHTLGVGAGYSQEDVRQMAELLTGLIVKPREGQGFNPKAAEPGPETVLGQVYEGKGVEPILRALEDLAVRPETGRHLARKLAVHFVADDPPEELVVAMAQAYAETGGSLLAVYGALLNHPLAWEGPLTKLRQPFDFLVAGLRGLGVAADTLVGMKPKAFERLLLEPMAAMGQPMNRAGGPDGWPEEAEAWITPQRLAARITWAMQVPSRLVKPLPEPLVLAQGALGGRLGERLELALGGAESRRDAVGLVLSSPEFNRR